MLVYNMSKAVLHSKEGEMVGQALLCGSSFWNAMVNRRRTNGGVNCLRPKVYKLYLPGPLPSMLGALYAAVSIFAHHGQQPPLPLLVFVLLDSCVAAYLQGDAENMRQLGKCLTFLCS